jgi:hypothetical protein
VADLKTSVERRGGRTCAPGRRAAVVARGLGRADETVDDHAALQPAVADGRIEAVIDR